jgi:hypothetical protein
VGSNPTPLHQHILGAARYNLTALFYFYKLLAMGIKGFSQFVLAVAVVVMSPINGGLFATIEEQ